MIHYLQEYQKIIGLSVLPVNKRYYFIIINNIFCNNIIIMSTKNIEMSAKTANDRFLGNSYDGKKFYAVTPSLYESNTTKYFTPNTGVPSSYHTLSLDWGSADEFNLEGLFLEFTHRNLNATSGNSQIIYNPYLLFSEFKIIVNGQELIHMDNQESIFLMVAFFFNKMTDDERTAYLSTIFPTQKNYLSGQTLLGGGSQNWSLPLEPLCHYIKHVSRTDAISQLKFEFRFVANFATAVSNCRFLKCGADVNLYNEANISFSNIALRIATTKHTDPILKNIPYSVFLLPKYDVKTYQVDFSTTTAIQRIQLSTEFTRRTTVHAICLYMYNTAGITAYNDADACKIDSSVGQLGWEVKYKSKTVMKYDTSVNENVRRRYQFEAYQKKHAKPMPPTLALESDDTSKIWIPNTYIDLTNCEVHDEDTTVVSGFPSNADLELIVYNATPGGSYSSSANLQVALCYYEMARLLPNGTLQFML
jgi:hypothetical protein